MRETVKRRAAERIHRLVHSGLLAGVVQNQLSPRPLNMRKTATYCRTSQISTVCETAQAPHQQTGGSRPIPACLDELPNLSGFGPVVRADVSMTVFCHKP
jgi:hypothetical protein